MKVKTKHHLIYVLALVLGFLCMLSVVFTFWAASSILCTLSDAQILNVALFGLISGLASVTLLHLPRRTE